ncbi:MAG TPA: nucleotide exchange factor GrpE [Solirubrobacterales bacterium]|nr:nucleotide exchange factor GrpE [Solirubrobacterales bacterium]
MSLPSDGRGTEERRPAGPVSDSPSPPGGGDGLSSPPAGDADQVEQDFDALLADAHKERDEYLELAKRTKADFENFRKRMSQEVQAAGTRSKAALVGELVHVVDNLERALEAAETDNPLAQGVQLTYRDLCMALDNHGVEVFDPVGEKFDPTWHEALTTKPAEDSEPGTVIETMQKGYRLGDQLIRPARVIVSE